MMTVAIRAAPWTALPCGGSSPTSQAKRIDIVVVYKVDRLTRSLADFAKIVEVFDASGVSFVSVTQAFNTTTSMGRLTLNVLLSFAQFEREVTGERIRDKIAASKKKGLWMGGFVPFGYRAKDRTLSIDRDEAETVRLIYSRYLELGTVSALEAELAERNVRTRPFTSASNKTWGDRPFSRGHLYRILSNPIYSGKIVHNDKQHDGRHEAIIDRKIRPCPACHQQPPAQDPRACKGAKSARRPIVRREGQPTHLLAYGEERQALPVLRRHTPRGRKTKAMAPACP